MDSKTARYQFYSAQWYPTLQQMIDHELMVTDAETREVKVSDGEVREEIQTRFGECESLISRANIIITQRTMTQNVHLDSSVLTKNSNGSA